LKAGCSSIAALGATCAMGRFGLINALAQSTGYRALVCIFLYGGNNGNQTLVPMDARYNDYATVRGNLAIAQNALLPIATATAGPFGLHPSLTEIQQLYNSGAAAIVANVGTLIQPTTRAQYQTLNVPLPDCLYSHYDQQAQNQSAIGSALNANTGWGGRIADLVQPTGAAFPVGMSVAGNVLYLDGKTAAPATIIPGASLTVSGSIGTAGANARDAAMQQLLGFDSGLTLVQAANGVMQNGLTMNQSLNAAFAGAPPMSTTFPNTDLGAQLQQIAQIIQVRATLGVTNQIFFASLGGFDTHVDELNQQGGSLTELSQAVNAFYDATAELGVANVVTTFTQSDFSRTLQPNTKGGSDHAWGNHQIVIGGAVKGGNLYGTFPTLALSGPDDAIDRGVWIPTTSIDQYAATLASWFGLNSTNLQAVFANLKNFSAQNLGFV